MCAAIAALIFAIAFLFVTLATLFIWRDTGLVIPLFTMAALAAATFGCAVIARSALSRAVRAQAVAATPPR